MVSILLSLPSAATAVNNAHVNSSFTNERYFSIESTLAVRSDHVDTIQAIIDQKVLSSLASKDSFLDIGAGPGAITEKVAESFNRTTVVEPNPEFRKFYRLEGYKIYPVKFEECVLPCCYDLCDMVNPEYGSSAQVISHLQKMGLDFEVFSSKNQLVTDTFEEMRDLLRVYAVDDCFSQDEFERFSAEKQQAIFDVVDKYTRGLKTSNGKYFLTSEDDYILVKLQSLT